MPTLGELFNLRALRRGVNPEDPLTAQSGTFTAPQVVTPVLNGDVWEIPIDGALSPYINATVTDTSVGTSAILTATNLSVGEFYTVWLRNTGTDPLTWDDTSGVITHNHYLRARFVAESPTDIAQLDLSELFPGYGVPAGGLAGQVLTKASNDSGDADWEDGGGGGSIAGSWTVRFVGTGANGTPLTIDADYTGEFGTAGWAFVADPAIDDTVHLPAGNYLIALSAGHITGIDPSNEWRSGAAATAAGGAWPSGGIRVGSGLTSSAMYPVSGTPGGSEFTMAVAAYGGDSDLTVVYVDVNFIKLA